MSSAREEHLAAISTALLKLEEIAARCRANVEATTDFNAALIAAVGQEPGTDPGQRAAEIAMLLAETHEDARRQCAQIEQYLGIYKTWV